MTKNLVKESMEKVENLKGIIVKQEKHKPPFQKKYDFAELSKQTPQSSCTSKKEEKKQENRHKVFIYGDE